jgi:hypothetical protein
MLKEVVATVCESFPSTQQETSQSSQPMAKAEFTDMQPIRRKKTSIPRIQPVFFMLHPPCFRSFACLVAMLVITEHDTF